MDKHSFIETDITDSKEICKICFSSERPQEKLKKNIFTIIPPEIKSSYCKCHQYVHDNCLIHWCIMKYTLQCPDCNYFFNFEIEKFLKETNSCVTVLFSILFLIIIFITNAFGILSLYFYFTNFSNLWIFLLGILLIGLWIILFINWIINTYQFSLKKDYVFQIKINPDDRTFEKVKIISKDFQNLVTRLYQSDIRDIFLSKINESVFQKIEVMKKQSIYHASKTFMFFRKKSSINDFGKYNQSKKSKNWKFFTKSSKALPQTRFLQEKEHPDHYDSKKLGVFNIRNPKKITTNLANSRMSRMIEEVIGFEEYNSSSDDDKEILKNGEEIVHHESRMNSESGRSLIESKKNSIKSKKSSGIDLKPEIRRIIDENGGELIFNEYIMINGIEEKTDKKRLSLNLNKNIGKDQSTILNLRENKKI